MTQVLKHSSPYNDIDNAASDLTMTNALVPGYIMLYDIDYVVSPKFIAGPITGRTMTSLLRWAPPLMRQRSCVNVQEETKTNHNAQVYGKKQSGIGTELRKPNS